MNAEQAKFLSTRGLICKKRDEAARIIRECDMLEHQMNAELDASIDNDMDIAYLHTVKSAYDASKFASEVVSSFIEHVSSRLFKSTSPSILSRIDVYSIAFTEVHCYYDTQWTYSCSLSRQPDINKTAFQPWTSSIRSPAVLYLRDKESGMKFSVCVPVHGKFRAKANSWHDTCDGLYVVCVLDARDRDICTICKSFDALSAGRAIESLLNGMFDTEIHSMQPCKAADAVSVQTFSNAHSFHSAYSSINALVDDRQLEPVHYTAPVIPSAVDDTH